MNATLIPLGSIEASAVLLVGADTTLGVPGDYATLAEALRALDAYRIAGDVEVTIQLADGTYDFTTPILFNHPDGDRIAVLGNTADEAAVTLHYTGTTGAAIEAAAASAVGLVDGLAVAGEDEPETIGFLAGPGASLRIGPSVTVRDMGRGFFARGGEIQAEGTLATNSVYHGYHASWGGVIHASGSRSEEGTIGYLASGGAVIEAPSATAEDNASSGFQAQYGSAIHGPKATAKRNHPGAQALLGSLLYLDDAVLTDNGAQGVHLSHDSSASAARATASSNDGAGFLVSLGSTLNAPEAVAEDNGKSGFYIDVGSTLYGAGSQAIDNGEDGYWVNAGSTAWILGSTSKSTGNDRAGVAQAMSWLRFVETDISGSVGGYDILGTHGSEVDLVNVPGTPTNGTGEGGAPRGGDTTGSAYIYEYDAP